MRQMTSRERQFLFVTVIMVAGGLLYNCWFEPVLQKGQQLDAEINVLDGKLRKALVLVKHKDFFWTAYPRLCAEHNLSGQGQVATSVMLELETLASGARLTILDLRPDISGDQPRGIAIPMEMRAEGSMEAVFKFLYDYERSLALLRIRRFSLTARPRSELFEARFYLGAVETVSSSGRGPARRSRAAGWVRIEKEMD